MHTVGDIVNFILKNRGNSLGFKDWRAEEICASVIATQQKGTMIYGVDDKGNVDTVMVGVVNGDTFRVINILTTRENGGKLIVKKIMELFPACTHIQFNKRGTERKWPLNNRTLEHLKGGF